MTAVIFVILLLLLPVFAWAQSTYSTLYTFTNGKHGATPVSGLVFDHAGNLYGTTVGGGSQNCEDGCGVVFKLTPSADGSWKESVLHFFAGGQDGAYPSASLAFDREGNLYGTTANGGSQHCTNGCGVVFELAPSTDGRWTESVLYSFTGGLDGALPYSIPALDSAGNLYGTTLFGGDLSCGSMGACGVVFELTPNPHGAWTERVLHRFRNGWDGSAPVAGVILDAAGNLYGTASLGGVHGWGAVFELMPKSSGTWTEIVLHSFNDNGKDGVEPYAPLTFDKAGNLYGTTYAGGDRDYGVVFQLSPTTRGRWKETVLHQFTGRNDGDNSSSYAGPLIVDEGGNVYGTTTFAGAGRFGVVFRITQNSKGRWDETVLHSFYGHTAGSPWAGVIADAAGNLYGTDAGGYNDVGSVFEITP